MFKFPKEKYRRLDQQPFSRVVLCYCTNAAPSVLITLQAMEGGAPRALWSCALQGSIIPWSGAAQCPGFTSDPSGIALLVGGHFPYPLSAFPWLLLHLL